MSDQTTRELERSFDPEEKQHLINVLLRQGLSFGEAFQQAHGFGGTELAEERKTDSTTHRIRIDGELYHVTRVRKVGYGDVHEIETEESEEFILSEDSETAGEAARERWADMVEHDPEEFTCMVGEETLVKWALGQFAGPGSTQVRSLSEWLDLSLNVPEEEWAGYDGNERTVDRVGKLASELGFTPTVAYRCN